jgi:RNA polymerase sigma-70 factor (ECF subfamily)
MEPPRISVQTPVADFDRLYREHAGHLHRFALYLSGNRALAEDLVSEAFVRVWTIRDRVEATTVRGYLCTIVRNLFLQERRRQQRGAPLDESVPSDRPGPDVQASDQIRLRTVIAALDLLSEVDRAAVLMRADQSVPYEDIAIALGISVAAAKVKVHRARLKLAEALEAPGPKE